MEIMKRNHMSLTGDNFRDSKQVLSQYIFKTVGNDTKRSNMF